MLDRWGVAAVTQSQTGTEGQPTPISYPKLSLPEGGGARSYGETFQPNAFTGTASFGVPVYLSPARGQTPQLSLRYQSGGGNSPFGLGFSLDLPVISRRTDKGIPQYDGTDLLLYNGGQPMVPRYRRDGDRWVADRRIVNLGADSCEVVAFRPRVEGAFDRIEQWTSLTTGSTFWQVTDRSGTRSVFGRSETARIADPDNPLRVYQWLIEETVDAHGNRVRYHYKQENDENVPPVIYAQNRSNANRYIEQIQYGNYRDANGEEQFAFAVLFDYGEYDLPALKPVRPWAVRQDPFSTYRPGFEVRTQRLCRHILLVHHLPDELGAPESLVNVMKLTYRESPEVSVLAGVQRIGYSAQPDGTYLTQALPQLEMAYEEWNPQEHSWQSLTLGGGETVQGLPGQNGYQMIDLYGDGLPGLLLTGGATLLYWPPLGDGRYAQPRELPHFPAEHQLSERRHSLLDVDGNGRMSLVVGEAARGGYYPNNNDGRWDSYREFPSYAPEFSDPAAALVDLSGSGRAGILTGDGANLRYYRSLGGAGFAAPSTIPASGAPGPTPPERLVHLAFADMFGDGLSHRVCIADGSVTVWPSLGNGRFGPRVQMAHAPAFGPGLSADRIFLADVTGSGTADLIFLYADHCDLFCNLSGNSFAPAQSFSIPEGFDDLDQAQMADVLGIGLAGLVISKAQPLVRHLFLNFSGRRRPYLLTGYSNGMGQHTQISYRSSTEYFLKDSAAGRPWLTSLPFPVQVVSQVQTDDPISGSKTVRVFQYSHGYYDPVERQFLGFGSVQWQDTRAFSVSAWHFPDRAPLAEEPAVEPLLTRAWNHTGAYADSAVSRQMAGEYFHGDPYALQLPDSVLTAEILAASADTIRQAVRALADHRLHTEEYALSADGAPQPVPLRITEATYLVQMLQPCLDGHDAVFLVTEWEGATSEYDGTSDDPRIAHRLTLQTDPYGNALRKASVAYPRRRRPDVPLPGQTELAVTVELDSYINRDGDAGFYLIGIPCEQRKFELSGLAPGGSARYFTWSALQSQVDDALQNQVPYGHPFAPNGQESRLYGWTQDYFWNEALTEPLPLGWCTAAALLHHRQQAVFSAYLLDSVFGDKVTPDLLTADGGYRQADGYWWNDGLTQFYLDAGGYFQPTAVQDPFGNRTVYAYDPYLFELARVTDCLGRVTTLETDYRAMQPRSITDHNQNLSEALYDPLLEVMVTSIHGVKDGKPVGNAPLSAYQIVPDPTSAAVLADPARFLQGAGSYFFYDLRAQAERPPLTILLQAHRWAAEEPPGDAAPIGCAVTYFDASARTLCKKTLITEDTWLTVDRTAYDNKGNPVRRYLPYETPSAAWDPNPSAPCTVYRYDALNREVQLETPKGFLTRTVYSPWSRVVFDQDDTVLDSPYYQAHIHDPNLPPAERAALEMAAGFADTPTTTALDTCGRDIQVTQVNIVQTNGSARREDLPTYTWLDVLGNALRAANPRFYNSADPDKPSYYDFIAAYDMASRRISWRSADAGNQPITGPESGVPLLSLSDVTDKPIHVWDQRGYHVAMYHDALRRLIRVHAAGDGLDQDTERITYGDDPNVNTVDRVVLHRDQAGEVSTAAYNLIGKPVRQTCRLRQGYKEEVNWNDPDKVALGEAWHLEQTYDAAGLLQEETNADGSRTRYTHYRNGWVGTVSLRFPGRDDPQSVVESAVYHPSGAPLTTRLANGVTTHNTFDAKDYRLVSTVSRRETDGRTLQDLRYTYDPVGNVTHLDDGTQQTVFFRQGQVDPGSAYTYDAIYRLRAATGRHQVSATDPSQLERYTRRYGYDPSGNLLEIAQTSTASWVRKLRVADFADHAVPEEIADPSACFDAAGNLITLEHLRTITYDYRNQMSSATVIERGGGQDDGAYFVYDSTRQRARKVAEQMGAGGATTRITDTKYIGNLVVSDTATAGGPAARETTLRVMLGERCVMLACTPDSPGARLYRYQLDDRLGSVTLEVNESAEIITYEEYYPFGGTAMVGGVNASEVDRKRYRYSGKELDRVTGLYYYGVRYYIPWLGRWTTADPAETVDGLNLFRFVRNNPVTLHDPKGEYPPDGEDKQQKKSGFNYYSLMAGIKQVNKGGLVINSVSDAVFKFAELRYHEFFHHDTPTSRLYSGLMVSKIAFGAKLVSFTGGTYSILGMYKSGWQSSYTPQLFASALMFQEMRWLYKSIIAKDLHGVHKAHFRAGMYGGVADTIKALTALYDRQYKDAFGYSLLGLGNFTTTLSPKQTEWIYQQLLKNNKFKLSPATLMTFARFHPVMFLLAGAAVMAPKGKQ